MLQIIVQGRGGQGAQTAGNLLAQAYFELGREVQAFASYGGARRGTPVSSFIRVDERPIRLRCDIEQADAILCFDATLLEGRLLAAAQSHTLVVVNSARERAHWQAALPGLRVMPVDGIGLSREAGLGRIVNSALLRALAAALAGHNKPDLVTFDQAIEAHRAWKVRLRQAIADRARLDAETLCRDDQCPLGKWIHGPGGARWGSRPGFTALTDKHAEFHREAGAVARRINAADYTQAERLIGAGSRFSDVSTEVVALLAQARRGL